MALKSGLLSDLYVNGQEALRQKDELVKKLQQEISAKNTLFSKANDIYAELRAQYPAVTSVIVSEGVEVLSDSTKKQLIQLSVKSSKPLSKEEKIRIESWFKVRIKNDAVALSFASENEIVQVQTKGRISRKSPH